MFSLEKDQKVTENSKKSNVNDILELIKTIFIVLGFAIAFWELIIKNYNFQRIKAETTLGLMRIDASSEINDARQNFAQILKDSGVSNLEKLNHDQVFKLESALVPQTQSLIAWESCFKSGLCDEEMGKSYICNRAIAYANFLESTKVASGIPDSSRNKNIFTLADRCSHSSGATGVLGAERPTETVQ